MRCVREGVRVWCVIEIELVTIFGVEINIYEWGIEI